MRDMDYNIPESITASEKITVEKLLRINKVPIESVLIIKNGEPIPVDEELSAGDVIELLPVLSGG